MSLIETSEYENIAQELHEKYSNTAFPSDPLSFSVLSTIRYDPKLSEVAPTTPQEISRDNFFLLAEHCSRLQFTLNYFFLQYKLQPDFGFSEPLLVEKFIEAIALSQKPTTNPYKIRLLVQLDGNVKVEVHDTAPRDNLLDGLVESEISDVWNVYLHQQSVLISPFTSFKTTNRSAYTEARKVLPGLTPGREEVLIKNSHGMLMEGSITNVAIKRRPDNAWITPQLSSGCLCGVMRHFLLRNKYIQEGTIFWQHVEIGSEVLLFNGVMGVFKGRVVG